MKNAPAVLIYARKEIWTRKKNSAAELAHTELVQWLKKKSYEIVDATDSEDKITQKSTKNVGLAVVIGGDGTFLRLVRRLEKKDQFPIMGINLGTLGFITEFDRSEMIAAVHEALQQKYPEQRRSLMHVELWRKDKCQESGFVFNDAVITKDARTSMLKLDVSVGGEYTSFVRADGYIVSTPTGSTAYCLSAGGPLLHPEVDAMVLVPICSHSLSSRPIVIPKRMSVEIVPREFKGSVYLVYDGQINYEIKQNDLIKIRISDAALRLIRSPKQKWSETLRSKLNMD